MLLTWLGLFKTIWIRCMNQKWASKLSRMKVLRLWKNVGVDVPAVCWIQERVRTWPSTIYLTQQDYLFDLSNKDYSDPVNTTDYQELVKIRQQLKHFKRHELFTPKIDSFLCADSLKPLMIHYRYDTGSLDTENLKNLTSGMTKSKMVTQSLPDLLELLEMYSVSKKFKDTQLKMNLCCCP